VAAYGAPLILMHMKGMPQNMQLNPNYDALIDEVFAFFHERLEAAQAGGIPAEHLLLDPGIGFGKGTQHNLELLRKLHHFHALGRPLVIGPSRKSFIGRILETEVHDRLEGTAAAVAAAILQGVDILRVHDVQAMGRVARMLDALLRPNFAAPGQTHRRVEPSCAADESTTGE
jgi:dihydropteroate synthase